MVKFTVKFIRGLPASGKSTLSKKILDGDKDFIRVNKDDIRKMLLVSSKNLRQVFDTQILRDMLFMGRKSHGKLEDATAEELNILLADTFSNKAEYDKLIKAKGAKSFGPKEKWVIKIQTAIIEYLIMNYWNIIIDDTNYNNAHLSRIRQICDGYDFEIIDMHRDYGISLEECIKRNKNRVAKVPEVAIYSMNSKYGVIAKSKDPINNKSFTSNGKYIICDLDGTLCDIDHRLHFVDGSSGKKDWKGFFDAMGGDKVRENTKQLLDLTYPNHEVVIVTGRPSNYRSITGKWLKDNNVRYSAMYMRSENDHRPDTIVKQEILDNYLDKNMIEVVIDDRPSVVRQWRRNGLPVIDVGDGKEF